MMKTKIIITLAAVFVILTSVNITSVQAGSEVLLNEDFEGGMPVDWAVVDGGDSVDSWFVSDGSGGHWLENMSSNFMLVDSFTAGIYDMDEHLVTNTIDCNDFDNISLEFEHTFMSWAGEICDVDILMPSGQWQTIASYQWADAFGPVKLDISQEAKERGDVQIRWRYYNANWAWHWAVDNIVVRGIQSVDDPVNLISGYVLTESGDPIDNVTVTAENPSVSVYTDPDGYYELQVPFFWSGQVAVEKQDFSFEPNGRLYENVTYDLNTEDYTGGPTMLTISGKVGWTDFSGIEGAAITTDNGGYSDITDLNGDYSLTVPFGWSGSVTVSKPGYDFDIDTIVFVNILTNLIDQDFVCSSMRISGYVRDVDQDGLPGAGIEGVTLSADNGAIAVTAIDGSYELAVPDGFSGSVTPQKNGLAFDPTSNTYTNVTSDMPDEDYIAGDETYTISGYLRSTSGQPIAGAAVSADNGGSNTTSQSDGYYQLDVPFWWAGTVTVSKNMYTFTVPDNYRDYSNIYHDQDNQSYIGQAMFRISGHVKFVSGLAMEGINVTSTPNSGSYVTDSDGYYQIDVIENWSGTITVNVDSGYSHVYSNVNADFGNQDFVFGKFIYVDAGASPGGNGQSWESAYKYFQDGLDGAVSGDEIWVAAGMYYPSAEVGGGGPRYQTFQMINGVAIYGGFNGTETSLDQRDVQSNETILSGDIGEPNDPDDNCYHVFYHPEGTNLNASAILDGFSITAGNANDATHPELNCGGGMYNSASSPTVSNCSFIGNSAENGGGGAIYNSNNSSPTITNCSFTANSANGYGNGGGIENANYSSPTITNCSFTANSSWEGGGIYNSNNSSPTISNCSFIENSASYGGGISNSSNSSPTITNCIFSGNNSRAAGGIFNVESSPTITNCSFTGNSADTDGGGGIFNIGDSSPTITNCSFTGNSASYGGGISNLGGLPMIINCSFTGNSAYDGGGIFNDDSFPKIINCSFMGNSADMGGGISNIDSYAIVTNCILWGNTSGRGEQIGIYYFSLIMISHTDLEGGLGSIYVDWDSEFFDEGGNIDMDPKFVFGNDPHLSSDSPCIDAGDNGAVDGILTDMDGVDRILDGDDNSIATVDMGACEYIYNNPDPVIAVSQRAFRFLATGGQEPGPDILQIRNSGGGTLDWTIEENCDWLEVYYKTGQSSGQINNITLETDITGLAPGKYICELIISDSPDSGSTSINSPVTVAVVLTVGRIINVPTDYPTIQAGIDAASDGDIVIVADGTYSGTGNYDLDFGGKLITLKSENGPDNCIIDPGGLGRGFHFHTSETDQSVLDGFTIQNGNNPGSDGKGGGIYNYGYVSPMITNCTFKGNNAHDGGGIYNGNNSSPTVSNCTFSENTATEGGGIFNGTDSSATIINCTFTGHIVSGPGGGIRSDNADSSTITNCTFRGNSASTGGGIDNVNSPATITNCTFIRNRSTGTSLNGGGGIHNNSLSMITHCSFTGNSASTGGGIYNNLDFPGKIATITHCTFTGNSADNGGGITNLSSNSAVTNCIFSGNHANAYGGGIYNHDSSLMITNSTFNQNHANAYGGGILCQDASTLTLSNCILWENSATTDGGEIALSDPDSTLNVAYCDVKGGEVLIYTATGDTINWGAGNIDVDPLFKDPVSPSDGGDGWGDDPFTPGTDESANDVYPDLRLGAASPCIDVGVSIDGVYSDIRGSVRPIAIKPTSEQIPEQVHNHVDMGAYEYSDYYSGTEDGTVEEGIRAFTNIRMPAFALVGTPVVIKWENSAAFPNDRRINLPRQYQVNVVLVSEDESQRIVLKENITVSNTMPAEGYYSTEYTFGRIHAGVWKLRIELYKDQDQYNVSADAYEVLLSVPAICTIGQAINPPGTVDLSVKPQIDEDVEGYFFWSDHTQTLYAVGPAAAVIIWTDDNGDPLPQLVASLWPTDQTQIQYHVADSPAVELLGQGTLLPDGSTATFVEIRYTGNSASLTGDSQFDASFDGYSVLLYGENSYYECTPYFEVIRTVLWDDAGYLVEHPGWEIGREVEPDQQEELDNVHDYDCGNGYVFHEISPYDPVIYDRSTHTGQIFAVNLDAPNTVEDDLVVLWYEKGDFGAYWPHVAMRYTPKWPETNQEGLEKIVIASEKGSEVYDQDFLYDLYRNIAIYSQDDRSIAGFNPNDEHALISSSNTGSGFLAVYALRNDLNHTDWDNPLYTSEPYVLVKYQVEQQENPGNWLWRYRIFKVLVEADAAGSYPAYRLEYEGVAGNLIQPPVPISQLLLCGDTSYADMPGPWWTDYNGKIYARHGGVLGETFAQGTIRWFYPLQEEFYYDYDGNGEQDASVMDCIPWLDHNPNTTNDTPLAVSYKISWPQDCPVLNVGETLFTSKVDDYGNFLPDIMNQCSVSVIFDEPNDVTGNGPAVKLIDPLSERSVHLAQLPTEINTRIQSGKTVFVDLPYHLRKRVYYDSVNERLVFKGHFDDVTVIGEPLVLLNIMSEREREQLKNPALCSEEGYLENPTFLSDQTYLDAVDELYELSRQQLYGQRELFGCQMALSAGSTTATGYVTLALQGDQNCQPLPISVEVIRVECPLYRGELKVIESDNIFDERLTLRHSGDFGGEPEKRVFEWMWTDALDEPESPEIDRPQDMWAIYVDSSNGEGVVDITVGGAGLLAVKDLWFSCRYRGYDSCGVQTWSQWTEPQLHESWVKRVMRGINLFDQRVSNFHETEVNTFVDMISQLGKPYEGDVALNNNPDNLNNVGLIELYETLLRRAKEFSIDGVPEQNDESANRTLQFASSRLADLYMLLGNEAYADAQDPTIGFGTDSIEYNIMAPSIFCFQNQVDSLLSEELALLRGLDDAYTSPLYNRLIWNFTSGEGELAYALSYGIADVAGDPDNPNEPDGIIDETDARVMYPQGHGDAWGYYLMAIKKYYNLLSDNEFDWKPQSEYVLVAGTPVEVDYLDERKFAKISAAKARCGAEIVDLTYRQNFSEDPEEQWQGYMDTDTERAWGVSEWACRAGQGAYFDWAVANALLPDNDPNENHVGLQKIDRTTVVELREIASSFNDIQMQQNKVDLGLNPMGVAKDAIQFDINPYELIDAFGQPSGRTHFEQIYDRAMQSLNNAVTTFNYANQNTQLIRNQQDSLTDFNHNIADREADFNSRLIEVFGYPYGDDIGPTGTYPEGYDGPDIYHYMYVDPSELMGVSPVDTVTFNITFKDLEVDSDGGLIPVESEVEFTLSKNGLGLIKPETWTENRMAPGEIQMARSDLLQTKARFEKALKDYDNLLSQIEDQAELLEAQHNVNAEEIVIINTTHNTHVFLNAAIKASRTRQLTFRTIGRMATLIANALAEFLPKSVGFSNDVTAPGRGAIRLAGSLLNETMSQAADSEALDELDHQQAKEIASSLNNIQLTTLKNTNAILQQLRQLEQLVRSEASVRLELYTLEETMQQMSGRYLSILAKGNRLLNDRLRFRKQTANNIQEYRYKDMAFRVFRNEALQKYRAQFDMAAMYVYLAAKAYDYETAFLDSYSEAGQHFLTNIVRQRAIGKVDNGVAQPGDGLAGVMAELKQNFDVLKGMMGFNNPQVETTWFSLRKEHFRIFQGMQSNSDWQNQLDQYYVANLWDIPEFRRYCKPFDSEDVILPAIVIPFETNITNGLNFFGWPGGADPYYAPENFVTKIRSVGIWFSNYDTSAMSPTPRVYMIPVGEDRVRADIGEIRNWRVVEQRIPEPFQITEYDITNNFEWIPMNDTVSSPFADIRRHTRFRAYPDGGFNPDEMTYDSRLIGRSVWNTRWLLIIPGHSLYLSDPWEGINRFIEGPEIISGGGERTGNGVTDIKLFFKTYAYPGY